MHASLLKEGNWIDLDVENGDVSGIYKEYALGLVNFNLFLHIKFTFYQESILNLP